MRSLTFALSLLTLAFLGLTRLHPVAGQAAVQESAAEQKSESSSPGGDAKKYDDLLRGLDSQEYSERQEASQKLAEEGLRALSALEKGATSESREVATRCLDLLKKLHDSKDAGAKEQAKSVLEKLAKSEDVSLSGRAKKILTPPAEPAQGTPMPGVVPGFRIAPAVPAAGAIRLQVRGAVIGGGGKSIQVKEENGVRDIESQEKDKKVKIHDDPEKGIQIEVTETKDGKEETKKYEAKNAEELKKNHPEAHKIYEELGKGGPKIEIGGIGIGGFGGGILPAGGVPIPVPAAVPAAPAVPLDPAEARKFRLQGIDRSIEGLERAMEQLQKQKARLLEQKAELEKDVEKPAEKPAEAK